MKVTRDVDEVGSVIGAPTGTVVRGTKLPPGIVVAVVGATGVVDAEDRSTGVVTAGLVVTAPVSDGATTVPAAVVAVVDGGPGDVVVAGMRAGGTAPVGVVTATVVTPSERVDGNGAGDGTADAVTAGAMVVAVPP
jgi:hypothetical protein